MRNRIIIIVIILFVVSPIVVVLIWQQAFTYFSKPTNNNTSLSPKITYLACPLPEKYCKSYTTEKSKLDNGSFYIFPTTIPAKTPIYAVWDGELQPGRAGIKGQLLPSITITNKSGLSALYLFGGTIEGNQMLPRKVKKGETIGKTGTPLPPVPNTKDSVLMFSIQKPNSSSATPSGKMNLPTVLNEENIKFEQ